MRRFKLLIIFFCNIKTDFLQLDQMMKSRNEVPKKKRKYVIKWNELYELETKK